MDIPSDPDFYLEDDQSIKLNNSIIQVRHAPGHSPGSVVFYIDDIKTAVVGDLIFYQGIGRTDLDGGSFNQLKKSIETQIFTLPPQTLLIPGHGPTTTVGEEMRLNPYVGAASQFL
ncbi:MAG TPA: MBL fold metallo-hydrolase [Anaerolineaceae bacterium]|nr:MBL fold metallo-hydrolase [Anaerolineaceae bacterium]